MRKLLVRGLIIGVRAAAWALRSMTVRKANTRLSRAATLLSLAAVALSDRRIQRTIGR